MRDLKRDLEICQKATPGPWEWRIKKDFLVNKADKGFGYFVGDLQHHKSETSSLGVISTELNIYGIRDVICYTLSDKKFITEAREGWLEAIQRAMGAEAELAMANAALDKLKAENERLLEALQKIAHPLDYLTLKGRKEGKRLSGLAVAIANDANYLKDIARTTLGGANNA